MRKRTSTAEKVRRLIDQGYTNKAIIEKLGVKPQVVYNTRYQVNKARGLGAIGTVAPVPVEGIGAPPKPKRKYTRRAKPAGTGINSAPPRTAEPFAITMYEPPEAMWKVRLKNFARALGWRG